MGNLITKVTTNNMPLDESNISDITICDVIKQKTPPSNQQKPSTMFKILASFDPRSPSAFINRTPITMFRNNSRGKFIHQELNESIETQVDIEILTKEEEESLGSTSDIFNNEDEAAMPTTEELLDDPRSPITEITRTPIVAEDLPAKFKKEEALVKKLAEKLIAANIAADVAEAEKDLQLPTAQEEEEEKVEEEKPAKKKNAKNFVFEDEENLDRFSTPPKAKAPSSENSGRTPLSSLNNSNKPKSRIPTSSTPKSKFHTKQIFNEGDVPSSGSKIPRSTRRLQQQVEGM